MTPDPGRKRKVLRGLTYGLYVVTTRVDGGWTGASVSWLTQVSFDPTLVLMALKSDGMVARGVQEGAGAIVHLPGESQVDVVKRFFVPPTPDAEPPLHGEAYREVDGLPVLEVFPAWFRVEERERLGGGDHDIVVAEVTAVSDGDPASPLRMHQTPWSYGG